MKELLFKPFEKYAENKLLLVGILFSVIGLFIGDYFNASFDGVLDVHFDGFISLKCSTIYFFNNIVCAVLTLFIVSKLINKKTRIVDILVTVLVARIPLYIVPFFNVGNRLSYISELLKYNMAKIGKNSLYLDISTIDMVLFITTNIVSLVMVVWYVALLFNGYKTASNAKGAKSIVLFILAILIAEIGSKLLMGLYNI